MKTIYYITTSIANAIAEYEQSLGYDTKPFEVMDVLTSTPNCCYEAMLEHYTNEDFTEEYQKDDVLSIIREVETIKGAIEHKYLLMYKDGDSYYISKEDIIRSLTYESAECVEVLHEGIDKAGEYGMIHDAYITK